MTLGLGFFVRVQEMAGGDAGSEGSGRLGLGSGFNIL